MNPWRNLPVHRIFVFVEHGMTPEIIDRFYDIASEIGCGSIIDPFVGGGVVAVEGLRRGFNIVGLDVNPWSLIVSMAKTLRISSDEAHRLLTLFRERLNSSRNVYIPSKRLEEYHRRDHLVALGRIRAVIESFDDVYRPLLFAVLGGIADKYSLLRRSPAPRFRSKVPEGNPLYDYLERLAMALEDLSSINYRGIASFLLVDSSEWLPLRICGLLTSPPFANNIDYIRHTQLQLLWAGFAKDRNDLGYWRDLQIPACEAASRAWKRIINDERINDLIDGMGPQYRKRYGRFLRQYFYYMYRHLDLLAERLDGIAWYTVGDSILGGVHVPTHRLLADHLRGLGIRTEIERVSDRYSRGRVLGLYLLKIEARR